MESDFVIPDIYLMKREKTRAGCMTVFVVMLIALLIAAAFFLWKLRSSPRTEEPVTLIEFPEAPVESEIPPVVIPDMPEVVAQTVATDAAAPAPAKAPSKRKAKEKAAPPAETPPAAPAQTTEVAATDATATAPAPPAATGDADALMAQAKRKLKAGDHQAAREKALAALAANPGNPQIEEFLNELAMPLLASQRPMPEKIEYRVQSGDYLGKLAATYNTPVALIAKANNIQGAMIRIGETLRLLDGNKHIFAVSVSKSQNTLLVTLDGQFFKRYRVGTGTNNITPVGTFKITDKIEHPPWHKPGQRAIPYGDPENQLGTHWLAFDLPGYGIHGTWQPESIGQQSSAGCVRMINAEVEELYTILPKGTIVTVTD
ncbi:MAG: L,D-transpeptidase family protein [Kiritimatiellia bacterium]|jgi:lipoprotein-anchoring transpeptidase ErfK/SrfK|nr:L,D-transpeptidase family protein [Lentisphaerota bacterium]